MHLRIALAMSLLALAAIFGGEVLGWATALPTLSPRASTTLAIACMALFILLLTAAALVKLFRRPRKNPYVIGYDYADPCRHSTSVSTMFTGIRNPDGTVTILRYEGSRPVPLGPRPENLGRLREMDICIDDDKTIAEH